MLDRVKNRAVIFVIIAALASPLYAPCGGGSGAAARTIGLGGIVMIPTSSLSISAPLEGIFKTAPSEEEASGVVCHIYTLEGEDLGSVTTGSDGSFTLTADLVTLKGSDDTTTAWAEGVVLECDNGIELYSEVSVDEGSTTEADLGTAGTDTTLACQALAANLEGFNGWGRSYKDVASNYDLLCIFDSQKAMWVNSALSDEEGLAEEGLAYDNGVMREVLMGYLAAGGSPASVGYEGWSGLIQAVMDGTISPDNWALIATSAAPEIGVDEATLSAAYTEAQGAFAAFNDLFAGQFTSGGLGLTALLEGGSICDDIKTGVLDPDVLVKPMLAADDTTSFGTTYGDPEGIAVHFGLLKTCTAKGEGACDELKNKPGAYFGYMTGFEEGDFSAIYADGEFDADALEGSFYAPKACSGATRDKLKGCAKAMQGLISAGDYWDQFMTDDVFDEDKFSYWGGYFTGQAEAEGFDPDALGDDDYINLWSELYEEMGDATALAGVLECMEGKLTLAEYSSCYEGYISGGDGTQVQRPPLSGIIGTYNEGTTTNTDACEFGSGLAISYFTISHDEYSGYYLTVFVSASPAFYYYLNDAYDPTTGTSTWTTYGDTDSIDISFSYNESDQVIFYFTGGTMDEGYYSCSGSNGTNVYEKVVIQQG